MKNYIMRKKIFLSLSPSKMMNLHWSFRWGYGEDFSSNCCFKKRRFWGWDQNNAKKAWKTKLWDENFLPSLSPSKMINLHWSFRRGYGEDFSSNCCFNPIRAGGVPNRPPLSVFFYFNPLKQIVSNWNFVTFPE